MTSLNDYTPFLKLKQNEIMALKDLETSIKPSITPFFDFPSDPEKHTPDEFIKKSNKAYKQVKKHLWQNIQLYLDTYDIDDLDINGQHSYHYLLTTFQGLSLIPVIGIDRTPEHKRAIIDYIKTQGNSDERIICFRVTTEDFESFSVIQDDISELFKGLLEIFTHIDLILDNGLCLNANITHTANRIVKFSEEFSQHYPVRKIIITGSSIPPSLTEVCPPNDYKIIQRNELLI